LQTYRVALSKLVNSLSWGPDIAVPKPIDPAKTILRIDINDYGWTEATWDRILATNPYGIVSRSEAAEFCYAATKCPLPHVRGDWFVAAGSVPPLYHEILDLPTTDRELERRLHIDVERNQRTGRAARAGFNASGVSSNNRLIERHIATLTGGAYWKSYDFSGNADRKNLFAHPTGPGGTGGFEHDGGEIIFNLPNGMQGYLLTDGNGNRIDKGPVSIVRDPRRPDSAVVNGLSCMSCHSQGTISKDDQVRGSVLASEESFSREELQTVRALYPEKADFDKLLAADAARFAAAVLAAGGQPRGTEPIVTLAMRFEEELDLTTASAEAGMKLPVFEASLQISPSLARTLGPLRVGGTVKRELYVANFATMVRELNLGTYFGKGATDLPASAAAIPTNSSSNNPTSTKGSGQPPRKSRWNGKAMQALRTDAEIDGALASLRSNESARIRFAADCFANSPPTKPRADVVSALTTIAEHGDHFERLACIPALAVWHDRETATKLIEMLAREDDHFVTQEIIKTLGALRDERAIGPIVALLNDPLGRSNVPDALKPFGEKGELALLAELGSNNREHLKAVCDVLGTIGTKASVPALEKLVTHDDWFVQTSARRALQKVKLRNP
jgi:hypothetical protein